VFHDLTTMSNHITDDEITESKKQPSIQCNDSNNIVQYQPMSMNLPRFGK